MTERLREIADALTDRARVPDGPFLGNSSLPTYDELSGEIYAALLAARHEAFDLIASSLSEASSLLPAWAGGADLVAKVTLDVTVKHIMNAKFKEQP